MHIRVCIPAYMQRLRFRVIVDFEIQVVVTGIFCSSYDFSHKSSSLDIQDIIWSDRATCSNYERKAGLGPLRLSEASPAGTGLALPKLCGSIRPSGGKSTGVWVDSISSLLYHHTADASS